MFIPRNCHLCRLGQVDEDAGWVERTAERGGFRGAWFERPRPDTEPPPRASVDTVVLGACCFEKAVLGGRVWRALEG